MGEPVTKQELLDPLDAQSEHFGQALNAQGARLRSEIHADVAELVRDAQTEILCAFMPFQESVNIRFRKLEANSSNLDAALSQRMDVLKRRLQEIEKKLLLNPPAA